MVLLVYFKKTLSLHYFLLLETVFLLDKWASSILSMCRYSDHKTPVLTVEINVVNYLPGLGDFIESY